MRVCETFHDSPSDSCGTSIHIHKHLRTDVRQTIDVELKHHQNISSNVSVENTVQVSPA